MGIKYGGIILSPYCSNLCVFCREIPRAGGEELRKQEISIFRNLLEFRKNGISRIEISGNDPIEYERIIPLIRLIKRMGFDFVQLSTHGKRLSDMHFLRRFILSGIDMLRIPLYGSCADIHDSVTRSRGSFRSTIQGMRNVLENSDIKVQVSCLVVKQNRDDLIKIIQLVKKLGIDDFYISMPFVANGDYSYYVPMKELGAHVKGALCHARETGYPLKFMEIPCCVFGEFSESVNNRIAPPDLGSHCQPKNEFRSHKKDWPSYRLKKKADICNSCACSAFCDGFPANDIMRYGTGNLKPISAAELRMQRNH